jgi:hypothetical protein
MAVRIDPVVFRVQPGTVWWNELRPRSGWIMVPVCVVGRLCKETSRSRQVHRHPAAKGEEGRMSGQNQRTGIARHDKTESQVIPGVLQRQRVAVS